MASSPTSSPPRIPKRDLSNPDGRRLYGALAQLATVFVTTNYDYWMDMILSPRPLSVTTPDKQDTVPPDIERKNIVYQATNLAFDHLHTPSTVIHLHGSLHSPETMVMTTSDYLELYRNTQSSVATDENRVVTFLKSLFNERVVLFIGYGLDELEILEYIILKSRASGTTAPVARHYILQPFFSHELEIANFLSNYYRDDCGVELLPFLRDENDHRQLINVLEHFARTIPASGMLNVQRRTEMEALLDG